MNDQRNELSFQGAINIESCNLHTTHGAFQTEIESTGWNLKLIMKGCFQVLEDLLPA